MDIGSIFLILALIIIVALFIGRPLFERKAFATPAVTTQEDHELSGLLAERDQVINALQELDFDYTLGKIPSEDYPEQRAALISQGSEILRKLDALQPSGSPEDAQERIETAIAVRRADAAQQRAAATGTVSGNGAKAAPPDDDLEAMIANRKRDRTDKAAGFCPQCGGPVQKADHFCPKCGYRLA